MTGAVAGETVIFSVAVVPPLVLYPEMLYVVAVVALDGVPLMTPVAALNDKPGGSAALR